MCAPLISEGPRARAAAQVAWGALLLGILGTEPMRFLEVELRSLPRNRDQRCRPYDHVPPGGGRRRVSLQAGASLRIRRAGLHAAAGHRHRPVPATGPYRIARYNKHASMLLVRNPFFREWSSDAQPAGYPDKIAIRFDARVQKRVTAVERETADYTTDLAPFLSIAQVADIGSRYPSRLHATTRLEHASTCS